MPNLSRDQHQAQEKGRRHQGYAYFHRLLHWLVAVGVLVSLITGATMGTLGFAGLVEWAGSGVAGLFYTLHKSLGVALLALMTVRIASRLLLRVPDHDPPLGRVQRQISQSVHHLLYLLLVAMPVLGWLATATGGYPVQFLHWNLPGLVGEHESWSQILFRWHGYLGWLITGLASLHILAALHHWLIRRDGVMQRMSLFR